MTGIMRGDDPFHTCRPVAGHTFEIKMKSYYTFLIFIPVSFISCTGPGNPPEGREYPGDSLLAVATSRVAVHNEWLASLKGISKTLDSITDQTKGIYLKATDRKEFPPVLVSEINTEIINLNTLLRRNEKEINALNSKLKGANVVNKDMQDSILNLNKRLAEKQAEMMDLYELISGLEGDFLVMQAALYTLYVENVIQNMTLARDIKETNTRYYATGTAKELEQKNIVIKDGTVPGFKHTAINVEFDLAGF